MAGHTFSPEEITARREAIYREQIRSLVETTEKGKWSFYKQIRNLCSECPCPKTVEYGMTGAL